MAMKMLVSIDMEVPPVISMSGGQPMAVPPKLSDSGFRAALAIPPMPSSRQASNAAPPVIRVSSPATLQQKIRRAAIVSTLIIALAAICAFTYQTYCTPKHSIMKLASAVDRRDREMVAEYVDAPALAESYHRFAVESFNRETAKTATNFVDHFLQPIFSQTADWVAGATITPDSVIDMLCGESPTDAIKKGLGNAADNTVDTFTKDGTPKAKVYGAATKALVRCVAGYAIDEAAADAKDKQKEMNPNDYEVTRQYESINRYLIKFTPRNSDDPAIGFVLKRHGLGTWKWSEVRLMPQGKEQTVAAQ